jgi:ATP-dependent helicase HrpA
VHYHLDKYDNRAQKVQELQRYVVRYWKDIEKKTKKDTVIPEHDAFRWALEEFRVSLFAQHTKPLILYPLNAWINYGMNTAANNE